MNTANVPGHTGASRAAFDDADPMKVAWPIFKANRTANLAEFQRLVRKAAEVAPDDKARPFVDYAAANLFRRCEAKARKSAVRKSPSQMPLAERIATQASVAAAQEAAQRVLAKMKEAWRLEQPTPLGKALGDCTAMECAQLGGFYVKLGEGVAPDQKIREVKTGDDVLAAQTWSDGC